MRNRFVQILIFLIILTPANGYERKSEKIDWIASYNKAGQFNLNLSLGGPVGGFNGLGFLLLVHPELILSEISPTLVPVQLGLAVNGVFYLGCFDDCAFFWNTSPQATLHWGVDFGKNLKFELQVGLGPALFGYNNGFFGYGYNSPALGILAQTGVSWHFSEKTSLIVQAGYIGWIAHINIFTVGILLNL